jgi:hypothetical protein
MKPIRRVLEKHGAIYGIMKRCLPALVYWLWTAIAFMSVVVVIFFTFINPAYGASHTDYRGIAILWFVTICPGMSLVSLLKLRHFIIEVTLAIALSLSLDAIIVGIFLYVGYWSPPVMLWVLITLSLIGPVRVCAQAYNLF